jgi:hypothetical protein
MAKIKLLAIVVVFMVLLLMTTPVSAVVTPPTTVKDALLKGIWGAIMDLQKQITVLTQKVDNIQTMPEYRAGSYTTPSGTDEAPWGNQHTGVQTVIFSHPMPDTNYRVSVTNADTAPLRGSGWGTVEGLLTIDSKTTTGFTFSYRSATGNGGLDPETHSVYPIMNNHKFDYIVIADN